MYEVTIDLAQTRKNDVVGSSSENRGIAGWELGESLILRRQTLLIDTAFAVCLLLCNLTHLTVMTKLRATSNAVMLLPYKRDPLAQTYGKD